MREGRECGASYCDGRGDRGHRVEPVGSIGATQPRETVAVVVGVRVPSRHLGERSSTVERTQRDSRARRIAASALSHLERNVAPESPRRREKRQDVSASALPAPPGRRGVPRGDAVLGIDGELGSYLQTRTRDGGGAESPRREEAPYGASSNRARITR